MFDARMMKLVAALLVLPALLVLMLSLPASAKTVTYKPQTVYFGVDNLYVDAIAQPTDVPDVGDILLAVQEASDSISARHVDSAASVRNVRFSPPPRIWLTRPGETPIRAARSARVRPRSRRCQLTSLVSWVTRASISSSIWASVARWSGETPALKPIGASGVDAASSS